MLDSPQGKGSDSPNLENSLAAMKQDPSVSGLVLSSFMAAWGSHRPGPLTDGSFTSGEGWHGSSDTR